MGAIGAAGPPAATPPTSPLDTPFMTAEMGGGMQVTYHRRPIVSADDIAAMMPVMLGSGVNLYGTYIFHGGENPDGKLTTLQESLATHYANDLPQKTYDFEAPIGEFGDERESLLKLKTWNYFLNDFGPILAPMQPHAPNVLPAGPRDLTVPRIAARTLGSSGFLFVNNHVRDYPMPARENFQVTIKLPGDKSVTLPSKPITLPPTPTSSGPSTWTSAASTSATPPPNPSPSSAPKMPPSTPSSPSPASLPSSSSTTRPVSNSTPRLPRRLST